MLDELIKLLVKVSRHRKPVGMEVTYDGKHWHWKFKTFDMTADEWQPEKQKEPEPRPSVQG